MFLHLNENKNINNVTFTKKKWNIKSSDKKNIKSLHYHKSNYLKHNSWKKVFLIRNLNELLVLIYQILNKVKLIN